MAPITSSRNSTHTTTTTSVPRTPPTNPTSAATVPGNPNLVSVAAVSTNSSSTVSASSSPKPSNSNVPPTGVVTNDFGNMSVSALSPDSLSSNPSQARKRKAMAPPADFDPSRFLARTAPIVPNGAAADAAALVALFPQLVIKELPREVTGDAVEAHLQEEDMAYQSAMVKQKAAKAIIKFNSFVEHLVASGHPWPWGKACPKSIAMPYYDYDGSFRLAFSTPNHHMGNALVCIAGALASLGAISEGGDWSAKKLDVFNIYVETIECVIAVMRYREKFIVESDIGGKDSTILLRRDKCSLSHSSLVKLFVGNIRSGTSEFTVEDTILQDATIPFQSGSPVINLPTLPPHLP
eukprot:Phypoly_transcript_08359.p1 GENE.Phypoly_transcript_08359~~Phypoly_transcript_08359.p1  ORF type:complete len:351 (-),score=43.65 Phypoly_transcript_08359:233-1285(-)